MYAWIVLPVFKHPGSGCKYIYNLNAG